jgi:2,7-dihydroxy-5-methyl-1-naphthoate 7-O-methyltransferase
MSEGGRPDLWAMADLCTPWCLRVVVSLGVPGRMDEGLGDVAALAAACGCDANALQAVLAHLVARGVFAQPAPGRFAMNEAARGLLGPGATLALGLEGIGGRMTAIWSTLPTYVRTGRSAYADLFGRTFWQDLDADPALGAGFDALMGPQGHGQPDPEFEISGGWSQVRTVCDVGGGTGALLAALLQARPWIRGTLVDLPRAVAASAATFAEAGVSDRATAVAQSFFDPLPAGADLYVLSKVLSDWPDAETGAILRRCAEAAGRSGRVVVMGGVEPDGAAAVIAVDMLLAGGRTQTLSAFRELAATQGLAVRAASRQRRRYVVELSPVGQLGPPPG